MSIALKTQGNFHFGGTGFASYNRKCGLKRREDCKSRAAMLYTGGADTFDIIYDSADASYWHATELKNLHRQFCCRKTLSSLSHYGNDWPLSRMVVGLRLYNDRYAFERGGKLADLSEETLENSHGATFKLVT